MVSAHTLLDETDKDGAFQPTAAAYDHTIEVGGRFEPEAGRYHLYASLGDPWAAGCIAALKYKGLEDTIGISIAHPTWRKTSPDDDHIGWHFRSPGDEPVSNELGYGSFDCDDALIPDTVNGAKTVRELYEMAKDTSGKYSTPILWCKTENTIVNNESYDILKILDTAFQDFCKYPSHQLFPSEKIQKVALTLNDIIYDSISSGFYKCGFAKTQFAYNRAHADLLDGLDKIENHLERMKSKRFLLGNNLSWLDIRLYMTLIRIDPIYVVYFKCNTKTVEHDYPYLLRYMRNCYTFSAIREATNLKHIKMHYFSSHPTLNTYGIIPASNGPSLEFDDDDE